LKPDPLFELLRDVGPALASLNSLERTLPNGGRSPASRNQCKVREHVAALIVFQLTGPEGRIATRHFRQAASMPVPKASMYKNGYTPLGKHKVRAAWESRRMKREAKPPRMEFLANRKFGLRPFGPNAGHHPASRRRVYDVNHKRISARVAQGCVKRLADDIGRHLMQEIAMLCKQGGKRRTHFFGL
jgi:hypothetical protein